MKANNHITKEEREIIETLLVKNKTFTYIGLVIKKDRTAISKEVKRNRYLRIHNHNPFDKKLIDDAVSSCKRLQSRPYVCNGCPNKSSCYKKHLFYDYKIADEHYKESISESKKGVNILPEEIDEIERQIIPLIKNNKQSINQVYINHSDILYFSKTTFYNYIDLGVFSLNNFDLPKKCTYKKRKNTKNNINKRELALLNGRRYENFINYTAAHPLMNIVEMDTVIGKITDNKCLFTLYIRKTHFMFIFLLDKKNTISVNSKIDYIKSQIGISLYSKVFRILLTDNGSEFFSVKHFEIDFDTNRKVSNLFFCHPFSSYEKHGIEVNHEYIRRVLPKGTSFENLNDDIVKKLQDNINAVPRISLDGQTPYDLTNKLWPDLIKLLACKYISPDDVTLSKDDILFINNI